MLKKTKEFRASTLPIKWNIAFNIFIGIFFFFCVFPFLFLIVISFTDDMCIIENGYSLFPKVWSMEAYRYIWKTGRQLIHSYGVTIFITVFGTLTTIIVTALYSYAISRKDFKLRKFFSFFCFFTMLFNGGMVPTYIIMTQLLHLKDTVWALILPLIGNAWYILILRTYFSMSISDSLIEAARIDGANEFYILFKIVLPISLPGLATIGLFSSLGYWNDWFQAMLYISDSALFPLQYLLYQLENNITFLLSNAANLGGGQTLILMQNIPQNSIRMAMVVICVGPIICAYPFFQRYFIRGLTVGSIKG